MASQTNEYEITSAASLSVTLLLLMSHEELNGWQLNASVKL